MRADSGFYSWELIDTSTRLGVDWSITVIANKQINATIGGTDDSDWVDITYPDGGHAQVAETAYVTGGYHSQRPDRRVRMIVRRTRLTDPAQAQLWPDWRYHAFVTSLDTPQFTPTSSIVITPPSSSRSATSNKAPASSTAPPDGFFANAAWLGRAVLAHNITRWTARFGGVHPDQQLTVTRTIRTRLFGLPGRLVNRSRRWTLRLPARWPWASEFLVALDRIRSPPLVT